MPALALPDFIEAIGPTGAPLAATAATWDGAPLVPTCAPAAGSMLPIGISAVSCSVSDPATRLSFNWAGDVSVRDTTAPAVAVPGDSLVADAQGAFGARVTYDATASDVVDGAVAVSCAPDAGAVFPLGATTVSCHAVDRAGNQSFAHFQVTVVDRSPATLRLADIIVDADAAIGSWVTFTPAPAATDIAGRPVAIECAPPSGSLFPTGATTVTCTGAPGTPNESEGSFTVMVVDRTGPHIVGAAGPSPSPGARPRTSDCDGDRRRQPAGHGHQRQAGDVRARDDSRHLLGRATRAAMPAPRRRS